MVIDGKLTADMHSPEWSICELMIFDHICFFHDLDF